jgi:YD repeat-containing protein
MQPRKPSRRGLLGGLLAGLFGWLLPRKAPAQPPQPQAASSGAGSIELNPHIGRITYTTYDANGDPIATSPPLTYQGTTVYTYNAQNERISVTDVGPPPAQGPRHG